MTRNDLVYQLIDGDPPIARASSHALPKRILQSEARSATGYFDIADGSFHAKLSLNHLDIAHVRVGSMRPCQRRNASIYLVSYILGSAHSVIMA